MVATLYKDRLAEAMAGAGVDVRGLAEKLGVSYQAVKKAVSGGTKSLSAANNAKAAKILGVDPNWLATGLEPPGDTTCHPTANVVSLQATAFDAGTIQKLLALPPKWQGRAEEAVLRIIKEHSELRRKSGRR